MSEQPADAAPAGLSRFGLLQRITLRDRVTLVATSVLALTLAIASVAGNLVLSNRLESAIDDALQNRAAAQKVTLERDNGRLSVRESNDDEVLDEQSWVFDHGQVVTKPRASRRVSAVAAQLSAVKKPTFADVNGNVRLLAVPVFSSRGEQQGAVVVGLSQEPYERTEHFARVATLFIDLFALLAAAFAVRWSVAHALRPVEEMTSRAAQWSDQESGKRFDMGEPFDEITGLAATLDSLLARIDSALRREQLLTAEIAHELRTPLASIRAEAELALKTAVPADRPPLEQIIESTDRTNAAIETLLAAHAGGPASTRRTDPEATARMVASVSRGLADARGVAIAVERPPETLRVNVDENALAQALSPVVENAVRHAKTAVQISLQRSPSGAVIRIADDGDGFDDADIDAIFEPGVSAAGGAGLGLPLARRLANTFRAQLVAIESPDGGVFELRIPDSA